MTRGVTTSDCRVDSRHPLLVYILLRPDVAGAARTASSLNVSVQIVTGHSGARQSGPGTVTFTNGVELSIPAPGAVTGACATGAYCFFQYKNYGGRKLTFRDCGKTGLWQFLTDYGFGDSSSSWQNFTKHTVLVFDQATQPPTHLWTENPDAESVDVGSADNKADAFQTFCG